MKKIENSGFEKFLRNLELGPDGIWSSELPETKQKAERKLREGVAAEVRGAHLQVVSGHHSIPVMDREIERFLERMPPDAVILDVGGCWGWHWRRIGSKHPDLRIIIVDFVRANLEHAKQVLGPLVGHQIALVHGDATSLPFEEGAFDGFWTVQTFQHIPDFDQACREAYRVLKPGGLFANYSINATPFVRWVYRLFGKHYHVSGELEGFFYLSRASDEQSDRLAAIFDGSVDSRYSECFLHPDLKVSFTGGEGNLIGMLDAWIGRFSSFARVFGRQRSFEVRKP